VRSGWLQRRADRRTGHVDAARRHFHTAVGTLGNASSGTSAHRHVRTPASRHERATVDVPEVFIRETRGRRPLRRWTLSSPEPPHHSATRDRDCRLYCSRRYAPLAVVTVASTRRSEQGSGDPVRRAGSQLRCAPAARQDLVPGRLPGHGASATTGADYGDPVTASDGRSARRRGYVPADHLRHSRIA
jgi:hypothetical protein